MNIISTTGIFKIAERHHAWHKTQEAELVKAALYVATRVDGRNYETVANRINNTDQDSTCNDYRMSPNHWRADTSFEDLKAWLNQRIRANPDERWLILSGTTLAEISAPPVTFRSV